MSSDQRIIVIGSGPTGAIAALTLLNQGIPVTLLEAGTDTNHGLLVRALGKTLYRRVPPMQGDEGFVSTGDPKTLWYRYFSPGGLSNQWTGAVPRYAPEDFDEGARLHEMYRWPVQYTDLLPYYESTERLLKVAGSSKSVPHLPGTLPAYLRDIHPEWCPVAEQAKSLGHGFTALPIVEGSDWMLVKRGTAFNSFSEIVSKLKRDSRFELILGAHVLHLEWSASKRKVTGVIYQDVIRKVQQRIEGVATIVAAGTLASTKILLNSTSNDFPEGLGNTHGVLGCFLHDHPKEWWQVNVNKPLPLLRSPVYLTRAPYADSEPLLAAQCTLGHASTKDNIRSLLPGRGHSFGVQVFGTMRPEKTQYVRLHHDKKDEFGQPVLDISMRYNEDAVQNMKAARERLLYILDRAGLGGSVDEVVPQLAPGSSVHYGGTVRMHNSPEFGILNRWNRLHDVSNVVVADASCFTTCVEKNPTLTAMALAARAADKLADDVKKGNI